MHWGQIKTVFIICFLVLNIFLVKQLLDRQEEDITFISETSREEELEFNINGLGNLSDESFTAPLISAQNYNYNEEAEAGLEELSDQQMAVVDNHYLFARFNEPISFDFRDPESDLGEYVFNGNSYSYWGRIESAGVLVFFQRLTFPVFYNQNAILLIQLNADGDMTQYAQTRLSTVGDPGEERSVIQQYDAVYRLYHHSNVLDPGDTISNVTLGYHNLVSLPNGEQLLNPTWDIQVNNSEHHFINAIEGHNYPQNDSFMQENISDLIERLEQSNSDNTVFYHLEDEDDADDLISTIRQALMGVYNNIVEVELE
ncbi:two-component system regulatory protein YycI [Amphibacillus sp. Q70]|uniref:two-component system regulatory protein YycI n=1 Tax=Amphibacillus sp. Q70 TaxID=3453416 RepID=UPI003F85CD5E